MGSERPALPPTAIDDLAERATRVRAMLARWAAEAVTDETEWSADEIEAAVVDDPEPDTICGAPSASQLATAGIPLLQYEHAREAMIAHVGSSLDAMARTP